LFSYLTKVYYIAKSASGRLPNRDKYRDTHPFYFVVDLDTLHRAEASLHYVEKQLQQNGAAKKSIVRSRGWPKIQDSPFTEKLWKSLSLISEQNNQPLNKTNVHTTTTASLHNQKQRGRQSMNKIFISYRRQDSADVTGRIYDRLALPFGKKKVFKDVDSIPLGVDFRQFVDEIVGNCDILIAVIGDQWLKTEGSEGKCRLDDPRDLVRIEIESALKRGIPVIPVLVQGATVPSDNDLPASLKGLVYRNGIPVRPDPDFHKDVDRLISGMNAHLTK